MTVFLTPALFLFISAAAVDRIKEITTNAHSVAGRVQNMIHALTDSVQHVGERVLHLFC